jgi:hypothetical protein
MPGIHTRPSISTSGPISTRKTAVSGRNRDSDSNFFKSGNHRKTKDFTCMIEKPARYPDAHNPV